MEINIIKIYVMENIDTFLDESTKNNIKSYKIVNDLIIKYKFKILNDSVKNDIRTLEMEKINIDIWNIIAKEKIIIITSLMYDENLNLFEYIEINYKSSKFNKIYKNFSLTPN